MDRAWRDVYVPVKHTRRFPREMVDYPALEEALRTDQIVVRNYVGVTKNNFGPFSFWISYFSKEQNQNIVHAVWPLV